MTAEESDGAVADRVVVRYAPATDRVRDELDTDRYRAYLRRAEGGPVAPDDEWDHFVSCGCGSTQDVALAVERVDGGNCLGDDTAIEFRPASTSGTDLSGGEPADEPEASP